MTTLGLKNVNMLSKEQYNGIAEPATDELYAISGSGFGLPSDRFIDLELGASGSIYYAPANGWVSFVATSTTTTSHAELNGSNGAVALSRSTASGQTIVACVPVQRGNPVKAYYSGNPTIQWFRFYYAEGEE